LSSTFHEAEEPTSATTVAPIDSIDSVKKAGGPVHIAKTPSSTAATVPPSQSHHVRLVSDSVESTASTSTDPGSVYSQSSAPQQATVLSLFSKKPQAPQLKLPNNGNSRNVLNETKTTTTNNNNTKLPKSPGALSLGNFFGWGSITSPTSSTTTFSEERGSPSKSAVTTPSSFRKGSTGSQRTPLGGIDITKANAKYDSYFGDAYKQLPPAASASTIELDEMEAELKTITAELATSIHREIELEDLVERLQSEVTFTQGPGKRTSDYFSDSGTSSVKYGGSESDTRTEDLDRLQRKAEREKAQIKLELNEKVQNERSRRKVLETQIRALEQKVSQVCILLLAMRVFV
jgi:hypothetical protein